MDVGRYRIVRRIGQGGMAEVFEALAVGAAGVTRKVAIKRILPEHLSDEMFARMFLDEARIASRLHHANIVGVLDFGVADGIPFQVLEYVDGPSGQELIERFAARGGRAPLELALHVGVEIAHGLDHAHRALDDDGQPLGIIHRDVSPGNVLVSCAGEVRLVDFGIALATRRTAATAVGTVKGSYQYMAPEQATGGTVGPGTDVFALGCTVHALLTGHSPLRGEGRMLQLLQGVPLPIDAEVPADVAAVLRRALAQSRHERYPDAAALAAALGDALESRVRGDVRRRAREILAGLEGAPRRAAAAGRLDALLGVDLVLESATPEARRFATRPSDPSELATTVVDRGARRRTSAGRWLVAATLCAALGVIGWRVVTPARDPGAVLTPAAPTLDASPPDGSPPEAVATAPPDGGAAVPPPDLRRKRRAPSAAVVGSGFLRVAGAGALDLEIRVDRRRVGYAPRVIEVPLGPHRVALIDRDGSVVAERRVEVTDRHTPSQPLVWNIGPRPDR